MENEKKKCRKIGAMATDKETVRELKLTLINK